jgi:hypothetical protein
MRLERLRQHKKGNYIKMTEDEREIKDLENMIMGVKEVKKDPLVETKIRQFKELTTFLNKWYYKPDMDALKIVLCSYAAHQYVNDNPVWLFVVGPSSAGKTEIAIKALEFLPDTYKQENLSPNSFLSGYGENNGLLPRITRQSKGRGVILFPEFSSVLSKRIEVRNEIITQLRSLYGGKLYKEVGNKNQTISWEGKITCVAAVTPNIEQYWAVNRELGERFLYVRWNTEYGEIVAKTANRQIGHETEIYNEFKKHIWEYVDPTTLTKGVVIDYEEDNGLPGLACFVAKLRTGVTRAMEGHKWIILGAETPEVPTRVSKVLMMIARASATLDRRAKIDNNDLELAKRVAIDSIPIHRYKIVRALLENLYCELTVSELKLKTKLGDTVLTRVLEDLVELEAITITQGPSGLSWVTLAEDLKNWWSETMSGDIKKQIDNIGKDI